MSGTTRSASVAWLMLVAAAWARGGAAQPGFEVVSKTETVENAPAGWVGRKTTDTEKSVGNTPETTGSTITFVLKIGGFVKGCPTAQGIAAGTYEFSLVRDEVNTRTGEKHHMAKRFDAKLEGHVRDDAMLDYIEIEGDITNEPLNGGPTTHQHVSPLRYTPATFTGKLDMPALKSSVELTSDLSTAGALLIMDPFYAAAVVNWTSADDKGNTKCLEVTFDPPSETLVLGPNESAQVRVVPRTKEEGHLPVAGGVYRADKHDGDRLEPSGDRKFEGDPPHLFTYTASPTPQKGDYFDIRLASRAGVAYGKWAILAKELCRVTLAVTTIGAEEMRADAVLEVNQVNHEQDGGVVILGSGTANVKYSKSAGCPVASGGSFDTPINVIVSSDDARTADLDFSPSAKMHEVTLGGKCKNVRFEVGMDPPPTVTMPLADGASAGYDDSAGATTVAGRVTLAFCAAAR